MSMDQSKSFTVAELAAYVDGCASGVGETVILRINGLESAVQGDITYVEDEKFFAAAGASRASCVIVPESAEVEASCRIEVKKPKLAFAKIGALLHPAIKRGAAIHATAIVSTTAVLDQSVYLGPHTTVGEYTTIGAGTRVEAGVVVGANVTIGSDCVLHPNVVLYDGV